MGKTKPPRTPLDYEGTPPTNRPATIAFVAGLLFFVFPFVPGHIAIQSGRKGIHRAAQVGVGGRLAQAGIVLGVVNCVLSVLLLAVPLVRSKEAAFEAVRRETCAEHLRAIGVGVLLYCNENRGAMPLSLDRLCDAGYVTDPNQFICPACQVDPSKRPVAFRTFRKTNYHVMLPVLPPPRFGYGTAQWIGSVLAYEPLANHDGAGANFLFHDGHVEWLDAAKAEKLIADTRARRAAGVGP